MPIARPAPAWLYAATKIKRGTERVKTVEVGAIGVGWVGGTRVETLSRTALVDKLHICDIKPDRLAELKARYKPATATLFRHVQTIQSQPTFFARLRTAVTGNGRAYIGWAAQFLSEGGDIGDGFYEVAVQPAGALKFRSAQLLEERPATEIVGGLDLVTNAANGATVAWGATTVKAAFTDARATFGTPQTVAPGLEAALAGAPDGRTLVAFVNGSEGAGALNAVTSRNGVFGPPEAVTAGPQARVPAAAYDAKNNRWGLVWSNRPSGAPPTFLQASSEPGGPPG